MAIVHTECICHQQCRQPLPANHCPTAPCHAGAHPATATWAAIPMAHTHRHPGRTRPGCPYLPQRAGGKRRALRQREHDLEDGGVGRGARRALRNTGEGHEAVVKSLLRSRPHPASSSSSRRSSKGGLVGGGTMGGRASTRVRLCAVCGLPSPATHVRYLRCSVAPSRRTASLRRHPVLRRMPTVSVAPAPFHPTTPRPTLTHLARKSRKEGSPLRSATMARGLTRYPTIPSSTRWPRPPEGQPTAKRSSPE